MKFEVVLQDNKKVIVTKEQADYISTAIFDKKSKQEAFKVGDILFKRSAIKGIFPIADEIIDNKEAWLKENREWDKTCRRMASCTIDEKIMIELNNRIKPGLKLSKITLKDYQLKVIELNIRTFFENNPQYPRCPMRIWWAFIAEVAAPVNKNGKRPQVMLSMAKWWEYVSRNDSAIDEWLKYNS